MLHLQRANAMLNSTDCQNEIDGSRECAIRLRHGIRQIDNCLWHILQGRCSQIVPSISSIFRYRLIYYFILLSRSSSDYPSAFGVHALLSASRLRQKLLPPIIRRQIHSPDTNPFVWSFPPRPDTVSMYPPAPRLSVNTMISLPAP